MIVNTEAIVLHSRKFGDTSKIVTLYTREQGKLSVVAKGARKLNNKYGSSLEPLSFSSVTYYFSQRSDLHLLSKSETFKSVRRLYESFAHLSTGLLIVEAVSQTQQEYENNDELFELLASSLLFLNETKDNPFSLFVLFLLRLASILGFEIDFSQVDEKSFGNQDDDVYLSLDNGAVISSNFGNGRHDFRINARTYSIMIQLSSAEVNNTDKIAIDDLARTQLNNFFLHYFSFHLERKFAFRSYNLINLFK